MKKNSKNIAPVEYSIWDIISNPFHIELPFFLDYLENLSSFLEEKRQEHLENLDEIASKIDFSKTDSWQMPPELEYDNAMSGRFSEFENPLFTSFFILIYSYLEAEFTKHCSNLDKQTELLDEKDKKKVVRLADLNKTKGKLDRNLTFLIKVQFIDCSKKNPEWEKIEKFGLLRNAIVHQHGNVSGNKKILNFIQMENSNLEVTKNEYVILNKEFCLDALSTIEAFLHSGIVDGAKNEIDAD